MGILGHSQWHTGPSGQHAHVPRLRFAPRNVVEATLTGFNGVEQQVQERALYSLPVFASTRDGPSVKMEIMAQGFQLPGLKHSILSETVLCKENNYVRGDILFDCPCLVRTADWHVIRLLERTQRHLQNHDMNNIDADNRDTS